MTRLVWRVPGVIFLVAIAVMFGWAAEQQQSPGFQRELMYMGKPLSYWLSSIRNRDKEMEQAFDAIRDLGPGAETAVPELTRIVAEPFTPVKVGVDKNEVIISRLLNIQLRADAIDALAAIGPAAARSSTSLIQWALTVRVVPADAGSIEDRDLFVDLVAIDVLERMRVAGAVAQFGLGAVPAVTALLASPDGEVRKLGVAILSENALPIAATLLKSGDCEDRRLGIALLFDLWPVVRKDQLI